MKKVLSLVLVAVLALGMSMSAFAAWSSDNKFTSFDSSSNGLVDGITTGYTDGVNTANRTVHMGEELAPMDEHKLVINLFRSMFGSYHGTEYDDGTTTTTTYCAYDLQELYRDNKIPVDATNKSFTINGVTDSIVDEADVVAWYATRGSYNAGTIATGTDATSLRNSLHNSKYHVGLTKAQADAVEAGTNTRYVLWTGSTGGWNNNNWVVHETDVNTVGNITSTQIRNSKLTIGTTNKSGSRVVDSVKLINKDGTIEFKLVKEWVNTGDQDFEVIIYPMIDGKRQDDYSVTVYGNVENPITEVYEDYDFVDLSKGYVAEAMEFVNNIEVDLGNGVSIFTKFFKGKKYYGTATRDADDAADVVFSQYPDVDNVVILNTVGLNSTGDIVKLDTDYSNYYVYDKDMKYLGQSSEMLPYSTRYYLANKQLNVSDVDDDDDDEDWDDDDSDPLDGGSNPGTGGDAGIPNANANPGTGR